MDELKSKLYSGVLEEYSTGRVGGNLVESAV